MRKIVFISQDPGGTNALVPIIQFVKTKYCIEVLAKDQAVRIYKREGIPFSDIMELTDQTDFESMKIILERFLPDLIITGTSSNDYIERNMWIAARTLNIKSIAILDSWCYYGLRFSTYTFQNMKLYEEKHEFSYLPDYILVMDENAKKQMVKEGIDGRMIIPVGQPFLQKLQKTFEEITLDEIYAYKYRICGDKDKKLIVYASDNLSDSFAPNGLSYWGYDEKTIFLKAYKTILKICKKPDEYVFLIRPHPKEKDNNWDDILKYVEHWGLQVKVDKWTDEGLMISSADIVIGMWSMFLVEAVIAKRPIISLQIGAKKRAPFVLEDLGLIRPILKQSEFEDILNRYFIGEKVGFIDWDIGKNAVGLIDYFIERII